MPVPFDEPEDIYVLSNLVTMSTRYSPWSEFDGTAGCEINDMKHCVAGLERFVSRFPGFSATRIKSNHEHLKYLDAEHARIIRELSVVRELQDPLVRFLEAMRMQYWDLQSDFGIMIMEQNDRLRAYIRMLLQRLRLPTKLRWKCARG